MVQDVKNLHQFGPEVLTCVSTVNDESDLALTDEEGNSICEESPGSEYEATAKYIDYVSGSYQGYRRDELWTGGNSQQLTVAAYFRFVGGHPAQQAHFLSNGPNIFFSFFNWAGGPSEGAFNIFIGTPDAISGDAYACVTAGVDQHGILAGDWFAFMFSVDVSGGGDPTRSCWVHKVGDASSTNVLIPPSPLETYQETWGATRPALDIQFDDTTQGGGYLMGAHPYYVNNFDNFDVTHFYMTNEYVDWSSAGNRGRFVNLANGKPTSLGNGAEITGVRPPIFLLGGDGTDNSGTAGSFTELNGPIADAATSPSD